MKILIIEDDPRSARLLHRTLRDDYIIDTARTGEHAETLAYTSNYDLFILDLILPDVDGEDLCAVLRSRYKNTPIIIITGKSSVAEKDSVFERGADDVLVKPINPRELKARIRAILRRIENPQSLFESPIVGLRKLSVDRMRKIAVYKNKRISLRKKEYQLLEFFMLNQGRVVTRSEILDKVWDSKVSLFTNTVDVHIKRLRDRIEDPFSESYFETVHGVGYIFE